MNSAIEAMQTYGGNFVRHLAAAYLAADPANRDRLVGAFGDLFRRYASIAEQLKGGVAK